MLAILNKLRNSTGQEGGMRKVPECKFREEQISIAGDLKGSHLLSGHFDDTDNCVWMLPLDRPL